MGKCFVLIYENNFIRLVDTDSRKIKDISETEFFRMLSNGLQVENGVVNNNKFKLHGNIKHYTLNRQIETFIIIERTGDNTYLAVNQQGVFKELNKQDINVSNVLNVKVVAYRSNDKLDIKIVPYSGTLETKGESGYGNLQWRSNSGIRTQGRCDTGTSGYGSGQGSQEVRSRGNINRVGGKPGNSMERLQGGQVSQAEPAQLLLHARHVGHQDFHRAISNYVNSNSHSACVDVHTQAEYAQMKCFLVDNGNAGVAIKKDGNIVSVFKSSQSSERGFAKKAVQKMLEMGGDRLDCYDINGFLPNQYMKAGMVPVCRIKFNREFAPDGWNFDRDGEPDIVFMMKGDNTKRLYCDYTDEEVPYIYDTDTDDAYTLAYKYRDSKIVKSKETIGQSNTVTKVKKASGIKDLMQAFKR